MPIKPLEGTWQETALRLPVPVAIGQQITGQPQRKCHI